jgi:dTDP-4-dehydrorhamnose 3,5-epimerase
MKVLETELPGVLVIEPAVYRDERGYFFENYHAARYREHGIRDVFVQQNQSRSERGVIRGLHMQVSPHPQTKMVRVLVGEIWDVAVDVRVGSPAFGRWTAVTLSADSFRQLYVPCGFAHGFCVTSDIAVIEYLCSDFYDPASELGVAWDDASLAIPWPVERPLLSDRDRNHRPLSEMADRLPRYSRSG